MPLPQLKSSSLKMFLLSFLILFFELVCIRWLSSYILYLGYFINFVLLGALLGMGAGTLLAGRPYNLVKWLPVLLFFFLVGGATEYLALYFGYQFLVLFAAGFYFFAFYFIAHRRDRVTGPEPALAAVNLPGK